MSSQTKQVNVRVSIAEDDLVRDLGGSWSEILRLGFEKWAADYPEFLQKKQQEYKELYSKCIAKLGSCYNNAIQNNNVFEEIYQTYIATGRDVNSPTPQDRSWVKGKLGKAGNGSHNIAVSKVFEYMQKRFNQDKQKRLEVNE